MSRKNWLVAGAAGALAVVIIVVVLVVVLGGGSGGSGGKQAPGSPQAENAAPSVAAALNALAANPQALMASSVSGLAGTRARVAVPAGTRVSPHPKSWQPNGNNNGTMLVDLTLPNGPTVTYLAVMVKEASGWKVLGTVPVPAAPRGTPTSTGVTQ